MTVKKVLEMYKGQYAWQLQYLGTKRKTIKEVEEEFGESIEDAIQEFIESCLE